VQNAKAPDGWGPRLAQETRLAELETTLAHRALDAALVDLAIERAALLGALNRYDEARQAYVLVLQQFPTHFSALNEFATLLARMGAIDAAKRVYAEAILHHPDNPIAHVNLANLLLRASEFEAARLHYEAALRLDPDNAAAHQGLGAVLSDLGDRDAARVHFEKGFKDRAISELPYRGSKPPVRLLQLVSSGGGNIPTAHLLDDTVFQTAVIVADHVGSIVRLPSHQLVLNAIGDADLCEPALKSAIGLLEMTEMPVINDPRTVMKTGRVANAGRLKAIAGAITALTVPMKRDMLVGPEGVAAIASLGLSFPLLLRATGYHTGRNFIKLFAAGDLAAAATSLPGEELLVIEYLDARGRDGKSRKYRVMMIDGELYPLHLAISQDWKVHYFTSKMSENADYRAEEARFLENMPAVLGTRAMTALAAIGSALGLDYAGVDFGLDGDGDLLVFEANASMTISRPDKGSEWDYRRDAIDRAIGAAVNMIMKKSVR
jgi:glutathione synthase/RimK-type ligase-like ATP-grasp enzyme